MDAKEKRKFLKHALHRQHQRQVLERRFYHSVERRDVELAEQTKLQLEQLELNDVEQREVELSKQEAAFIKDLRDKHLKYIVNVYRKLNLEDYSNAEARTLLHHMTKATATSSYENNQAALKGYAKQKFISRALLISDSIAKAYFANSIQYSSMATNMAESLSTVRAVVSVGCGPGCDLTGSMAGLETNNIQYAMALDYSMDEWGCMVQAVLSATTSQHYMMTCDIRQDPALDTAAQTILDQIAELAPHLLITFSYVLCETRDEWHDWMDYLVSACGAGTLWLMTEPTAWQLHIFCKRYLDLMDIMWLDTSMYREDLQELENRNGPAVLLCCKKLPIV